MTIAGFASVVLAAVLYGVQYVPVKKHEIYDGTVFQWFMCSGILFAGIVLGVIAEGSVPTAKLQDLLGGMCWAVSNALLLPVVKLLGLGLGFALFQATNVLSGYVVGRLGLFGARADPGHIPWLRDAGAVCLVISFLLLGFVDPPPEEGKNSNGTEQTPKFNPLVNTNVFVLTRTEGHGPLEGTFRNSCPNLTELNAKLLVLDEAEIPPGSPNKSQCSQSLKRSSPSLKRCSQSRMASSPTRARTLSDLREASEKAPTPPQPGAFGRVVGAPLVLAAGFLNTLAALPFDWWLLANPARPKSSFVFAQGLGAWLVGTMLYLTNASMRRFLNWSSPQHSCIRPAFISGAIWAFGFVFMCLGIDGLGFTAGFTYCSVLPVAVSTLLSILWFGEIQGRQQVAMFLSCFCIQIVGVLLIACGS